MLFTATVLTFRKMYMAGTLWKWTNYFSGWQERWFVLDNGILSYYKTQDDVNTGCKGSVKMSVCDIAVHPTDSLRLDLIIPGEQHFYVRASNPKERQEWLVALGSTKASMGQLHEKSGNNSKDLLKTKRSELRLYCDLLMQQMHSLKVAVSDKEVSSQRLDEVTSLVQPTCDMFLRTLGECMDLVQTVGHSMETAHSPITDAALLPSPHKSANKKSKSLHRQYSNERHSRSPSVSSTDTMYVSRSNSFTQSMQQTTTPPSAKSSPKSRTLSDSETMLNNTAGHERSERTGSFSDSSRQKITSGNVILTLADSSTHQLHNISESISQGCDGTDVSSVLENGFSQTSQGVPRSVEGNHSATEDAMSDTDVFVDPIEARVPTFFSIMPVSMVDLKLEPDGGIPVETFLEACQNVLPIFDKFNTTAFAPVKMDFQGNIRKVRTKFSTDPALFHSLQNIVLHEISKKQQYNPSSATMALLWMKRSLQFICGFLEGIKQGEDDLSVAASNAYSSSLKPYHGWVVRGVFAVAAKALPYRSVFLPHLNPSMVATDTSAFQTSLMVDIEAYCDASKVVVDILDDFFASNHLNVEEPV